MQGIFQKENTDKALKYGIYRHLPTYEKIIRNLVSFLNKKKRYVFVFKINNSRKEFDVNEMIYNKYEEQSFGILEYSGKNFIAFSEIKK